MNHDRVHLNANETVKNVSFPETVQGAIPALPAIPAKRCFGPFLLIFDVFGVLPYLQTDFCSKPYV